MLHIPRSLRLAIIATALIIIPTLYVLYPHHSGGERLPSIGEIQAGGIDSPHWRKPISPTFDQEQENARDIDDDDFIGEKQAAEAGHWRAKLEDERARARGGRKQIQEKLSDSSVEGEGEQLWAGVGALEDTISGGVIMPHLKNETAKAELGRAAWRVLHLMTLRYPDNPTEDDRQALKSYFHLFSRLYPCGECGAEFQKLLKEYPPQTSSRKTASLWLCHVHNVVNARLDKPEFDCLTLDKTYDCGCGEDGALGSTFTSESGVEEAVATAGESDAWAERDSIEVPSS